MSNDGPYTPLLIILIRWKKSQQGRQGSVLNSICQVVDTCILLKS